MPVDPRDEKKLKAAWTAQPATRIVFTDEAGIHAEAAATVVAAVLVDPDSDRAMIEMARALLPARVPPQHLQAFLRSSAKDLTTRDEHGLWPGWPLEQRMSVLLEMMQMPRRLGLPVCAGAIRQDSAITIAKLTPVHVRHLFAFAICLGTADVVIRDYGKPAERGLVVAEDFNKKGHFLNLFEKMKTDPLIFDDIPTGPGPALDFRLPSMIGQPVFAGKGQDFMLQVVDAVAYGVRRAYEVPEVGGRYQFKAIFGFDFPNSPDTHGRYCVIPPRPTRLPFNPKFFVVPAGA
jgi:hypothetical protein